MRQYESTGTKQHVGITPTPSTVLRSYYSPTTQHIPSRGDNPGPSQQISQKFVETVTTFLEENRRVNTEVSWVPGHMGIDGNNKADGIAKGATKLEPATKTTTIVKLHRQLRDEIDQRMGEETHDRTIHHRSPHTALPSRFTLDRRTLGIRTQARTGHGHFDEYY